MLKVAFTITDGAQEALRETALAALSSHAVKSGGIPGDGGPISILATFEGRIVGGMIGKVMWNWLHADLVWVEEGFRGRDIGAEVMKRAEEHALEMKLTGIYLWTESWQAPGFYSKLGYTQFVEI